MRFTGGHHIRGSLLVLASRSRPGRPRTCNAVRRFNSDGKLHARRVHWGERHCDKVDLQGSIPWLRTTWRIPPVVRRAGSQLDNEGSIPSFATICPHSSMQRAHGYGP